MAKLVGNKLIECESEEELNILASAMDKDIEQIVVPVDQGHTKFRTKRYFHIGKFEFFKFIGRTVSRPEKFDLE